jgi:uncharacterized protein
VSVAENASLMTAAGVAVATKRDATRALSRDVPVDAVARRIESVDVLRGFALCGIVLANVHVIAGTRLPAPMEAAPLIDRVAGAFTQIAVSGSFYPLFATLFGLGFALQVTRAENRGEPWLAAHLRRLVVLLAIGVAHWILLWDATILVTYALLGVPLVLFRRLSRPLLVALAVCAIASQAMAPKLTRRAELLLAQVPAAGVALDAPAAASVRSIPAQRARLLTEGSYTTVVAARSEWLVNRYSRPRHFFPWFYGSIFGMFLLGVALNGSPVLRDPAAHARALRYVIGFGLATGIACKAGAWALDLWLYPSARSWMGVGKEMLRLCGGPLLAAGYLAGLLLAFAARPRGFRWLACAGRMTLTNYLLQSLVLATIFYGYGLGLHGQVGAAAGLLIAAAIALLQLPLSAWWLARFRSGPAEWLWRSLARGARQPLRLRAVHA